VRAVLQRIGSTDPEGTLARLQRYTELIVQWNRAVSNLISKNDELRIVEAHVLPSIELVDWMKSFNLRRWCDLGSGGGIPAIPLAICGVGDEWDLVESRRTKTLFLRRAIDELKLPGMRVLAARIEDLIVDLDENPADEPTPVATGLPAGNGEDHDFSVWEEEETDDEDEEAPEIEEGAGFGGGAARENTAGWDSDPTRPALRPPYDGFTSRATMTLGPTLEYAGPIVRFGGRAFLWKGSRLAAEVAENPRWQGAWKQGDIRPVSIEHSVVAEFERIAE